MSDYSTVRSELEQGTPAEILCATCPWDRLCITPPAMSQQQVHRLIEDAYRRDEVDDPSHSGVPMTMVLTALAVAGKDSSGDLCPVFSLRLSGPDGRQVADGVRGMMRIGYKEGPQS